MATSTLGIKVDERQRERIHAAAQQIGRTPHWLIKQAAMLYVDAVERGAHEIRLQNAGADEADAAEADTAAAGNAAAQPFLAFAQSILPQTPLRGAITAA